jgi:endonuclease-3
VERIKLICKALEEEYGRPQWKQSENLLDELIATVLSQNTTSNQSQRAFAAIKAKFGSWDEVRNCTPADLRDVIRSAGLAGVKATRIVAILNEIYNRHGKLDLQWMDSVTEEEALSYLQGLDGVGRKTAACVLMFGAGKPIMPVDTHVYRVATRLGLIEPKGADKAHDDLQRLVPPDMVYSLHVNLVKHGRSICKARSPACAKCVLREYCDSYREGKVWSKQWQKKSRDKVKTS